MRKIFVISCLLVVITLSGCGGGNSNTGIRNNPAATSEISFREYEHDFGKVAEGEKLSYTFVFDNKGKSDLIVSSASTTCGCTVPKYDAKPISPGASGKIEVVFDTSGRSGIQTKTITVKSNASKPVVLLKITAEVITNDK